jgi:hypothetical protein
VCHTAAGERLTTGEVSHIPHVVWAHDARAVDGYVLKDVI